MRQTDGVATRAIRSRPPRFTNNLDVIHATRRVLDACACVCQIGQVVRNGDILPGPPCQLELIKTSRQLLSGYFFGLTRAGQTVLESSARSRLHSNEVEFVGRIMLIIEIMEFHTVPPWWDSQSPPHSHHRH